MSISSEHSHDHGHEHGHSHGPITLEGLSKSEAHAVLQRADPTGTTGLRADFERTINACIDPLKGATRETIDDNDALRLKRTTDKPVGAALAHEDIDDAERPDSLDDTNAGSEEARRAAFMEWFDEALAITVLAPLTLREVHSGEHYSAAFIRDAYGRGARGGLRDLKQADIDLDIPVSVSGPYRGLPDGVDLGNDLHKGRLRSLYESAYTEIRTLSNRIRGRVAGALGRGLRSGDSAQDVAGRVTGSIADAAGNTPRNIPEWEIPQAYNDGRHAEYQRFGVEQVGVEPEYNVQTAGDLRVCESCLAIAADGPYPLSEARGMLPDHHFCRCILVIAS